MDHFVVDYGAKGDGKSDDRSFIQAAIDKAHEEGGGRGRLSSHKDTLYG